MSFERGRPSARDTQAQYARHARRYAESGLHRRGESLETVRSLAAATPADRALDIGTGTGFTAFALAGDGAHVLAVDLTPEMLAEGRRLGGGVGVGGPLRPVGCRAAGGAGARAADEPAGAARRPQPRLGLPRLAVAAGAAARRRAGGGGGGGRQEPTAVQRVGAPGGHSPGGGGAAWEAVRGGVPGGAAAVRCAPGGRGDTLLLGQRYDPGDEAVDNGAARPALQLSI